MMRCGPDIGCFANLILFSWQSTPDNILDDEDYDAIVEELKGCTWKTQKARCRELLDTTRSAVDFD